MSGLGPCLSGELHSCQQVNVEVGEVCPGCMRGTLATKDIKVTPAEQYVQGCIAAVCRVVTVFEGIMMLSPHVSADQPSDPQSPRSRAIHCSAAGRRTDSLSSAVHRDGSWAGGAQPAGRTSSRRMHLVECCTPHRDDGRRQAVQLLHQHVQEAAAAWIRRMHADPAYGARYQPYLDTLPTAEEVLAPEMWSPAMVAALQSPELVRHCRRSTPALCRTLTAGIISMQSIMPSGQHDGKAPRKQQLALALASARQPIQGVVGCRRTWCRTELLAQSSGGGTQDSPTAHRTRLACPCSCRWRHTNTPLLV